MHTLFQKLFERATCEKWHSVPGHQFRFNLKMSALLFCDTVKIVSKKISSDHKGSDLILSVTFQCFSIGTCDLNGQNIYILD